MNKRNLKTVKEVKIERPEPAKLSAEESIKCTKEFAKLKKKFIAAVQQ
jgi:hypothetical protein